MRLFEKIFRRLIIHLGVQIQKHNHRIGGLTLPKFGNTQKNLTIELPRRIINPDRIFIGDNVSIGPGSFLITMRQYPNSTMKHPIIETKPQKFNSRIVIGDNVTATGDLQIAAQNEIIIEDDVMFASNIHINDAFHGFENVNEPYKYQPLFRVDPIHIKKGCWIGQNVVICPGVTIGELAIIGANSVVTKSIPDRCIAIGNPAEVVKKWDENTQMWGSVEKTESDDVNRCK